MGEALGAILLIRLADRRGCTPANAGSFSNACKRLMDIGVLLGRYSSSESAFAGDAAGLKDAVG